MHINFIGDLTEAYFKKRINRFVAEIIVQGKQEIAHVPNTGRMKELLVEGAKIIVRRVNSTTRKTKFDLLMAYYNGILVSIDSKLPNRLVYKGFYEKKFDFFKGYKEVKKEVVYGNSRLDIGLLGENKRALIEVKCATYVKDGVAMFPDAPTLRGTKHVRELIKAKKNGIDAGIIFVIQRNDASSFIPNWEMDEGFSQALVEAIDNGVLVKALLCNVEKNRIIIDKEVAIKVKKG